MRVLLIILIITSSINLEGQFSFTLGTGTESISMGRTSVTLGGPSSVFGNQAMMIFVESFSLTANAARRYNIDGLDMFNVGVVYPSALGQFGLSIQQYGLKGYKEQKIGLAYSKKIATNSGISIQGDILNLQQFEFGNKSFISVEVGFISRLSDEITLGAHITSPASSDIDGQYSLPTRFRIGPKISLSNNTDIYLEIEKIIDQDPLIKTGLEYRMNDLFAIRMGFIPEPSEFSFGFAYSFAQTLSLDGGFLYDQRLGISPAVGLRYVSDNHSDR